MTAVATPPYLVPIAKFVSWWERIIELDDHFSDTLSSEEWQFSAEARNARNLHIAVDDVAMANGAVRFFAKGEGLLSVDTFGKELDPTFDWEHGQINLAPDEERFVDGPRGARLAELLVQVTGIPEQEGDPA